MSDLLPREEIAWVGGGAFLLGGLVLAVGVVLLGTALWRRVRLDERYSPVARGRAWVWILAGLFVMALGSGGWMLGVSLEPWDPVKAGEPVGILEVQGDRLAFRSAFSGESLDLGPRPRGRVVLIGDVLTFPSWARLVGLGSFHRVRQVEQPLGLLSVPEADPGADRLQDLVARSWFPGEHHRYEAPAVNPVEGRVSLTLLPDGGYGAWKYPGG